MMSGAHYIHDASGLMDFDLTVSYEKMVMDDEILGMCARVLRGIEVTDETLAVDLICELGPGEGYMAQEHTVRHMRGEVFDPLNADRRPREDWQRAGAPDATERARQRAKELLATHEPCGIEDDVNRAIQASFGNIRGR